MDKIIKNINIWIVILLIYFLFIWRTMKLVNAPIIDGAIGTNELFFVGAYLLLYFFVAITIAIRKNISLKNQAGFYLILFSIHVLISSLVFHNPSSQNVYAVCCLLLPMITSVVPLKKSKNFFKTMIFVISVISILYSFLGIYTFFSKSQLRLNLPIGVATTSVFFFIIVLPIINLAITNSKNAITKFFLIFGYISCLGAILLTVSRGGIAVSVLITFWIIFKRLKQKKRAILGIVALALLAGAFLVFLYSNSFVFGRLDFSRLFSGFSDNSIIERNNAAKLGLEIFKHNWLFGAGNGTYFTRLYTFDVWTDKLITAYGLTGLLDPHNGYVLILSENGIIGFSLLALFVLTIFKKVKKTKDKNTFSAFKQLLIIVGLYTFTSSDLFTVVGLSTVFWIIISLFLSNAEYECSITYRRTRLENENTVYCLSRSFNRS